MFVTILGYLLAVCIGISLGLIGGGGSILAAPILIYIMEVAPKSAFAMTLVIVGVASLIGAIPHWRQGNVNLEIVAMFAPSAMLGAYLGARLASLPFVNPSVQLVIFGGMMLVAAIAMIRKGSKKREKVSDAFDAKISTQKTNPNLALAVENTFTSSVPLEKNWQEQTDLIDIAYGETVSQVGEIAPSQSSLSVKRPMIPKWMAIALEGLFVGVLTGFIGIGGGFLVIPALVLLGKTPMKEAVGTSLIILTLKSVTGFAGYFGYVPIDWTLLTTFTVTASIGILIGSYISRFVSAKQLEKGFGYFVLVVAVFVLIQR